MTTKLTPEQSQALHACGEKPFALIDPTTNHVYVVVDQAKHERAMHALREHETANAIREGLADMETGRSMQLEMAHELTAARLHAQYGNSSPQK